ILHGTERMEVVGIIDHKHSAEGIRLANELGVPVDNERRTRLRKDIDIVIDATGNEKVMDKLLKMKQDKTVIIPGAIAYIISELIDEKEKHVDRLRMQSKSQELILQNITDGMVVIDTEAIMQSVNHSAEEIVATSKQHFLGTYIGETIENTS